MILFWKWPMMKHHTAIEKAKADAAFNHSMKLLDQAQKKADKLNKAIETNGFTILLYKATRHD